MLPFHSSFAEKLVQTSSRRSFHKAVEEALLEVSRRSHIASLCPCIKPPLEPLFAAFSNTGIQTNPNIDISTHPDVLSARKGGVNPVSLYAFIKTVACFPLAHALDLESVKLHGQTCTFRTFQMSLSNSLKLKLPPLVPNKAELLSMEVRTSRAALKTRRGLDPEEDPRISNKKVKMSPAKGSTNGNKSIYSSETLFTFAGCNLKLLKKRAKCNAGLHKATSNKQQTESLSGAFEIDPPNISPSCFCSKPLEDLIEASPREEEVNKVKNNVIHVDSLRKRSISRLEKSDFTIFTCVAGNSIAGFAPFLHSLLLLARNPRSNGFIVNSSGCQDVFLKFRNTVFEKSTGYVEAQLKLGGDLAVEQGKDLKHHTQSKLDIETGERKPGLVSKE